jgi:hypothetical protein
LVLLALAAGERAALRAAAATATIEVDRLAHERHASPFGAAREGGVLAALRLLRAALDRDGDLVAALRRATHSGAPLRFLHAPRY